MLKEQGNLLEENIKITRELLDFAKANNYKISLRTGDYCVQSSPNFKSEAFNYRFNRAAGLDLDLLSAVNDLYLNGKCFLPDYFSVICFTNYEHAIHAFKKYNLKTLGMKRTREVYRDEIQSKVRETFTRNYGSTSAMHSDKVKAKLKNTILQKYGVENAACSPEVKAKIKATNLERYGGFTLQVKELREKSEKTQIERYGEVQNLGSARHRAKFKDTMLREYGVENASNSREIREKRKETFISRYGSTCPFNSEVIKGRIRETNIKKYGVENVSSHPVVKSKVRETNNKKYQGAGFASPITIRKIHQTNLNRFGVIHPMQCNKVKEYHKSAIEPRYGAQNVPQCPDVVRRNQESRASNDPRYAKILEIRDGKIQNPNEIIQIASEFCVTQELNYLKEFKIKEPTKYTTELKLASLLDSLSVPYIKNAKKIHGVNFNSGYHDLDAYLPDYNLGIEINGLAYHSTNMAAKGEPKEPDYHFNKFKAFYDKGIKLLSFTDYEQQHFSADVEQIVKFHLGLGQLNLPKISKEFLEFNQIQSISESLNYGCFDPLKLSQAKLRGRMIEGFEYFDCGVLL